MPWYQGNRALWLDSSSSSTITNNAAAPIWQATTLALIQATTSREASNFYYYQNQNYYQNQTSFPLTTLSTLWLPMINVHLRPLAPAPAQVASSYTIAEEKAQSLLLRHLSREQRAEYEARKSFVSVSKSGRQYRISAERSFVGNIQRLDDREVFCIHGESSLPLSDHFLAQKLMIEQDEDNFLLIANRHGRSVL